MFSEESFQEIFQSTVRPLYRFVSKRTSGNRELSEDIVQEAYLRAVRSWRQHGTPAEPLAWLHRVTQNLLASHYRSSRGGEHYNLEADVRCQGDVENRYGLRQLLSKGLRLLGETQRAILCAYHVEGRTTREIAKAMEISERAVEGRLRRARLSLRGKLDSLRS